MSLASGALLVAALRAAGLGEPNPYAIGDFQLFLAHVRADPALRLVDLATFIPGIRIDLRYATPHNFMQRTLYDQPRAYLRYPVAELLRGAQTELEARGLCLKIFDAYRPHRITVAMWRSGRVPSGFVSAPRSGSDHNRGAAVDLTLVDRATGRDLAMPTDFDDFTERAGHGFADVPPEVAANRRLLREVLERHGFEALEGEWWHYSAVHGDRFSLLDIPIAQLTAFDEANASRAKQSEAHRALHRQSKPAP